MQSISASLCFCAAWSSCAIACTTPSSNARRPPASDTHTAALTPAPVPPSSVQARDPLTQHDAGAADAATVATKPRPACPELPTVAEAGTPCGDLHCLAFDSPEAAFAHVLAKDPRVIGIGESHAQKGSESIPSATRRFAESLLPRLCGRAHAMILEVWLPRNDCGDKRVEQVEKKQKPATSTQSKSNKDEYVALGYAAKRFGIEPSALVPTCDEYQSILDAGPDSIERMLTLIGSKTAERVGEELARVPSSEPGPAVIAYGGALHNDAEPTPDHEDFSYGPRVLKETNGNYVELDLIVREYVKDTEIWQRQPYYHALRKNPLPNKTLLYQWGEHSFGLVFAKSAGAAAVQKEL